ncbi:MAG: cobalt ECF transporter T component CbiQ, partial [Coriobacteriia bacterium]|nr:cobalt ECF transporter T component CbiQ [Coriobacteriia bacterium]
MITAILTMFFSWCLLFGKIPIPLLIAVALFLGAFFAYFTRHDHSAYLFIDVLAQKSRLRTVNPTFKFWAVLALMVICVASPSIFTGIFLVVVMAVLTVAVGRVNLHTYVRTLSLPVSFLMIGGLALLFQVGDAHTGVINLDIFGLWLCVTPASQAQTALVVARAFGAVSCLYLLSLSTPMPSIISVLRRAHCPAVVIDLMYLIYRYIFILLSMHHEMYDAAKSRLGLKNYFTSIKATGSLYANLLSRSYQFASLNYDAMESRCYNSEI